MNATVIHTAFSFQVFDEILASFERKRIRLIFRQ